jgi:hypothetical protein
MTRRLFLGALALVLLSGGSTQASLINWGFQTSSIPGSLSSDTGPGSVALLTSTTIDPSYVVPVVGNSGIVLANLQTFSNASITSPDSFTPSSGTYSIALTLYDDPYNPLSSNSTTVFINGKFQGNWSEKNSNISNTFTSALSQTTTVGDLVFTVSTFSYTPPGPPNATWYGSLGAVITVSRSELQEVPEPTSLSLAGLGLSIAGISAWRRRRASR